MTLRSICFRGSWKLTVPEITLAIIWNIQFSQNWFGISSWKRETNAKRSSSCTCIIKCMISVIISWWSSPVLGTATYGVTPLCSPPEYEKCQLCVYSEIALIKWPRRPIAIGLLRMIIITIYARPCMDRVRRMRWRRRWWRKAFTRPCHWIGEKRAKGFVFAKIMEDLIIRNYDACDQVIMNFLLLCP